jgi:long-chain acyl-CoA synthetase
VGHSVLDLVFPRERPREIEEVIYTRSAMATAAVVGVPDDCLGEEIKAFVQPNAGATASEEGIIEYVKARIAAYRYLRTVEFRNDLPLGPTGKVLKKELNAVTMRRNVRCRSRCRRRLRWMR